MDNDLIHKVRTDDGIDIVGKVIGKGPPLVFLPPGPAECEQAWQFVLPYLKEHYTCYLMNTRGRGLSDDHPDHSPAKMVSDVIVFVESLGQRVTLVEAGSGLWAYVAASNHPAISAVVIYEPGADEVMTKRLVNQLQEVFVRVSEIAAEGRFVDAAEFFIEHSQIIYSEEELVSGVPRDFWKAAAVNIPLFLAEEAEKARPGVLSPMDPTILSKIKVPVMIMQGTNTTPYFIESVKYVAKYTQNPHIWKIDQAAHFGIWTHPEAVAVALEGFLRG